MDSSQANIKPRFPVPSGKHKRALLLIILLVFASLLILRTLKPQEPLYQGRPLSSWTKELGGSFGQPGGKSAEAIQNIGTKALPYLTRELKARDSKLKVRLAHLLAKQHLVHLSLRMADERRDCAYKALLVLGGKAKPMIPELSNMLDDPKSVKIAGLALFAIGPDSVPALVAACSHPNRSVRTEAAYVLTKLETGRRGYTTMYFPMGSTNPVYRFAMTLGGDDISGLITNLEDDERPAVRRASAEALLWFSGMAKSATPALVRALGDKDQLVREAAGEALKQISPDAATSWSSSTAQTKERAIVTRAKSIELPEFKLDGVTLTEAVEQLSDAAKQNAPDGKGFNFLIQKPDLVGTLPKITLTLKNITVADAVERLAKAAGVRVTALDYAFAFDAKTDKP